MEGWKEGRKAGKQGRTEEGRKDRKLARAEIMICSVHCTLWAGRDWEHIYPEAKVSQTSFLFNTGQWKFQKMFSLLDISANHVC